MVAPRYYAPYRYSYPYSYPYRYGVSFGFNWGYPYYYGYPYASYGYYGGYGPYAPYPYAYGAVAVAPGANYGGLRIEGAAHDAQVYTDGYYAGVVDDFDGAFQHLNLTPGAHQIEIREPGQPPVMFDVNVAPGQNITYRVR